MDQDQKLRRVFEAFDNDNSGTIDLKELQQIFAKIGLTIDYENVEVLIKRYDEDNSGKLNFEEFAYVYILLHNAGLLSVFVPIMW